MNKPHYQTGLKQNWPQFSLLVLINAFVGGMVGLERTILPELAETEFGIAARTAIFSFIIVFGFTKAAANYAAGRFSARYGRKNMLIAGWLFGIPVPFMLMYAPDWNWIIAANVLLGINQGLAWSANVIMKIDLAGEKDRGLAMGLNEFAGYLAVAVVAFLTGWIAAEFGLRPYPFLLGIGLSVLGLLLTIFFVKDTAGFVQTESARSALKQTRKPVFMEVSWANRSLMSVSQAGLLTNFKDGMAWGIFPIFLLAAGLSLPQAGLVIAVYPACWGLFQVATGKLSDYTGRRGMLTGGMMVQGLSLLAFTYAGGYGGYLLTAALLGIGTAMVYPVFLAAIADLVHPADRAESVGVFRLWRDSGYAFGALFAGLIADRFSIEAAMLATAALLLLSAAVIALKYRNTAPKTGVQP